MPCCKMVTSLPESIHTTVFILTSVKCDIVSSQAKDQCDASAKTWLVCTLLHTDNATWSIIKRLLSLQSHNHLPTQKKSSY